MTTQTRIPIGAILLVALLLVGGGIFISKLPERKPPPQDPFQDDDRIYEVVLHAEWEPEPDGRSRAQNIHFRVGPDQIGDLPNVYVSPWEFSTTGKSGDLIILSVEQATWGELGCWVKVNGEILDEIETSDITGCFIEEELP